MKKSRKLELGFGLIVPGGGALVLGWTGTLAPYVFNIATFPGLGRNLLRLKGFFSELMSVRLMMIFKIHA